MGVQSRPLCVFWCAQIHSRSLISRPASFLGFVKNLFRSFRGKRSRRSPLSGLCGVCSSPQRLQTADSLPPTRLPCLWALLERLFLIASARINCAPENELVIHPTPTPRCGESNHIAAHSLRERAEDDRCNEQPPSPDFPLFSSRHENGVFRRVTLCHTHHMAPMSPHHPVLNGYWRVVRYRAVGQGCGCVGMLISFLIVKLTDRASSACPPVFIYPRFLLIPLPLPQLCTK